MPTRKQILIAAAIATIVGVTGLSSILFVAHAQHRSLGDVLTQWTHPGKAQEATDADASKAAAALSPTPQPEATTAPAATPVIINGRAYGISGGIPGEPATLIASTKPLIVSVSEITTEIGKHSANFTITSPDPTGICMPSGYSAAAGLGIASPGYSKPPCGMTHTMMITDPAKLGTYTLHFFADGAKKVNDKYTRYDGYITVHVVPSTTTFQISPANPYVQTNSATGQPESLGLYLTLQRISGYSGSPTMTFTTNAPDGLCPSSRPIQFDGASYSWGCSLASSATHGNITVTFTATDGTITRTVTVPINY